MSKNTPKSIQSRNSEIYQIWKRAPCTALGEERAEAADGEKAVGGEDSFEIGLVVELKRRSEDVDGGHDGGSGSPDISSPAAIGDGGGQLEQ